MAHGTFRVRTVAIVATVLVVAYAALSVTRPESRETPPPSRDTIAIASPAMSPTPPASTRPGTSPAMCTDFFTPPPYAAFTPIPGVSVRAIDKGHFEITNATDRTYYFGVTSWITEDNLVCG